MSQKIVEKKEKRGRPKISSEPAQKCRKPNKKEEDGDSEESTGDVDPIRSFQQKFTKSQPAEFQIRSEIDEIHKEYKKIWNDHLEKNRREFKARNSQIPPPPKVYPEMIFDVQITKKSGKNTAKTEIPDELPIPRKMTFFEPVEEVIEGVDELQLLNTPLVDEMTDDMAICRVAYKHYPNGIHGYEPATNPITNQMLHQLMKNMLPTVTNPDLFYYGLYRNFPNKFSQMEFSELFPKLELIYGESEEQLEPWKPEKKKENLEKFSVSLGNCFVKRVQIGERSTFCSENCFKSSTDPKIIRFISGNQEKVQFIVRKSKKDLGEETRRRLNTAFFEKSHEKTEEFCTMAKRCGAESCALFFAELVNLSENFDDLALEQAKPDLSFAERDKKYCYAMQAEERRLQKSRTEKLRRRAEVEGVDYNELLEEHKNTPALSTVVTLKPCTHLGPCGSDKEDCSCQSFCSALCQCDINCVRRFPGCDCGPNSCRTTVCPCYKQRWECNSLTCSRCDSCSDAPCRNREMTRNDVKIVNVAASAIAGNGAFLGEDVEKNVYLGEYTGEYITEEETERRGHICLYSTSYLFGLPAGCGSVDATRAGNAFRFVNHSDNPNCYTDHKLVNGKIRIGFYSKRAMRAGTELTFDYQYSQNQKTTFFEKAPGDRAPKMKLPVTPPLKRKKIREREDMKNLIPLEVIRRKPTTTRSGRVSQRALNLSDDENGASTSTAFHH